MRNVYFAMVSIFASTFLPVTPFAQVDSSFVRFYPLHIGNYWEYEITEPPGFRYKFIKEIIGDTILSDGQMYFVVLNLDEIATEPDTVFERINDAQEVEEISRRGGRKVLYRLNAQEGESWIVHASEDSSEILKATRDSTFQAELFDSLRVHKVFQFEYLLHEVRESQWFENVTEGLGFTSLTPGETIAELGIWTIQGAVINGKTFGNPTSVEEKDLEFPKEYNLFQNYPNPFNPSTTIRFQIPTTSRVTVTIYNTLGQIVRTLLDRPFEDGMHQVVWVGRNDLGMRIPSGVYFLRMVAHKDKTTNAFVQVRKMILLQ